MHPGAGKKNERYIWREAPYPGGQCVAAVYPGITGEDERALDYPWHSRQEAADANAALIVAAPDLLDALKDPCMMPALEAWAKSRNANAVRCLENARAAIAKAEGGTL